MSRITMASLELVSLDHEDDDGTVAMHFRPRHPLRFAAGQHGLWVVPGGGAKPFTIASAPEEELMTLGTNLSSRSRFKRALGALEARSKVRFVGPVGGFTLEGTGAAVVMLAQGMGVTPFRSMLRHVAISGADTRTTLIHVGARHPFRYDTAATVTAACYPTSREEFVRDAAAAAAQQRDATFMVSGSPAFVRSTAGLLTAVSVPPSQIARDRFYGYKPGTTAALPVPVEV